MRRGLVVHVAVMAVLAMVACNGALAARRRSAPRPASYAAIQSFINQAEQALHTHFTAAYRITLFKYRNRVFHGRVTDFNRSWERFLFRETPAFFAFGTPEHAYDMLGLPHGLGSCVQPRRDSRWRCWSDVRMGMGTGELETEIAPQGLVAGLTDAVDALKGSSAPYPLFVSTVTVDRRPVRCVSIGNPAGAVGRVCTMAGGVIVSYRMSQRAGTGDYATAELVGYSTKVARDALRPPAKVIVPSA